MWLIAIVLLAVAPTASVAQERPELAAWVVRVGDGDSVEIRVKKQRIRVRIWGIDAPELAQSFGKAAKKSLQKLCNRRSVVVTPMDRDSYGRMVARVRCQGLDAGLYQIRQGLAWVYRRFNNSPAMITAETRAKDAKRGLWSQPHAKNPQQWRRENPRR